jgi:glyoxylase-like metal-dependent hydrolase (beta-lactamase superfamily II)
MTSPLPNLRANQNYVQISAIAGGHITLPDSAFVSPADPTSKRYVPSLSFLITHPGISTSPNHINLPLGKPLRILFDLGLRQHAEDYLPLQQKHLENRRPYKLFPGVPEALKRNGIELDSIDLIILSHVHYDHHGDPDVFSNAQFMVGPGALDVLKSGLPPELGSHQVFKPDLLPSDRTLEFPPLSDGTWQALGPFPHSTNLLGDGALYVINMPGHLPGHINLLCCVSPEQLVCLAGDAVHDGRLLTGEREIGTWQDDEGRTCCIHLDRNKAEESILRLRRLRKMGVEIIAAHDEEWEGSHLECFLPGHL